VKRKGTGEEVGGSEKSGEGMSAVRRSKENRMEGRRMGMAT
jgi:hypothetical protein